jgi:putative FmdB family regulatory protein
MPIFEYKCLNCKSEFERLILGASSENGILCHDCQSSEVERLFSCFNGVSRSNGHLDGIPVGDKATVPFYMNVRRSKDNFLPVLC